MIRAPGNKVGSLTTDPLHTLFRPASTILFCCKAPSACKSTWLEVWEIWTLGKSPVPTTKGVGAYICQLHCFLGRTAWGHVLHHPQRSQPDWAPAANSSNLLTNTPSTDFLPFLMSFFTPWPLYPGTNTHTQVLVPSITHHPSLSGQSVIKMSTDICKPLSWGRILKPVGTLWQTSWFLPFPGLVLLTNA